MSPTLMRVSFKSKIEPDGPTMRDALHCIEPPQWHRCIKKHMNKQLFADVFLQLIPHIITFYSRCWIE